jgi:NAD(P)-dependent dehydrogenase (short-subunit alcohol dehydrogenase family)
MSLLEKLFSLKGKTALVTGASGGIGRDLAIGLAGAGAAVAVHGRNADEMVRTKSEIESAGGRAIVLGADLTDMSACGRLISDAAAQLGRLDILVNCAGMNRRKPITAVTEDDFDTIVNVNLKSLYLLSKEAHPIMKQQGGGKIVHVASLTSFIALGNTSVYGLTKVAQLAKTQAVEWAKDNIQVNCLAPGFIRTPLTEKSLWGDEKKRNWLLGRIPAKRGGTPADMVPTLLLLTAPGASYLTGQTIAVDGGVLAGGSWED